MVHSSRFGNELVHYNPSTNSLDKVETDSVLNGKKVLVYFSAHWCPPCCAFSPKLVAMYNELKKAGNQGFELVFVSRDQDEQHMKEYMKEVHMPWYAIPFNAQLAGSLCSEFEIDGIPFVGMVDAEGKRVKECPDYDIAGIKKFL